MTPTRPSHDEDLAATGRARHKTLATWLALLGGTLGLHRFYLRGWGDWVGWLFPIASGLGWWGVERILQFGQDDQLSWVLVPLLGLSLTAACLSAIVYGLTERGKWNARYAPAQGLEGPAGATNWLTISAVGLSLLIGATSLMASLSYSLQNYVMHQIEEGRKISQ